MQGASYVIFEVLKTANAHGILDQFLTTAAEARPFRPDLRQLVIYCSTKAGWSIPVEASGLDVKSTLEKLTITGDPFIDISLLAHWLVGVERQVGVVRCGTGAGTGFLVSPDLMLTCYHVVEDHLADKSVPVTVRFDYRRRPGEADPAYDMDWITIDPHWEIPHARYSKADETLAGEPDPAELDFALLKLSRRVGDQPPPGEEGRRRWIDLSTPPPSPALEAPILIVQHPGVDPEKQPPLQMPLKIAFATPGFAGKNGNGTRLIYGPSTKKGSSGSPVFDGTLKPVALHHNRGQLRPDNPDLALNNRGIPLHKIYQALDESVRAELKSPGG